MARHDHISLSCAVQLLALHGIVRSAVWMFYGLDIDKLLHELSCVWSCCLEQCSGRSALVDTVCVTSIFTHYFKDFLFHRSDH